MNHKKLRYALSLLLLFFGISLLAPRTATSQSALGTDHISADEVFDLNIREERINETYFERSTSVQLHLGGISLRAGAGVSASQIDVNLRGVTGHVRFRGSFDRLRALAGFFQNSPASP